MINAIYFYIILTALPLLLENYSFNTFLTPGSSLYSMYINLLYLLLPIILLKVNNFELTINKNQVFLIVILLILSLISFFFGLQIYTDYKLFINTILLSVGVFTIICLSNSFILSEEELNLFMVKMLHFVIFACLYNVIINIDLLLFGSSTLHVKRQFASFFSNKNTFGILLVIGIIVCTYLYMLNKKSKFFFVFLFFILNLIWTESTNSLISVIIFLATFFFMFYKINYIKRTLIIFAGVSISFFLLRSNFFEGVVNFMRFGDISELSGRTNLWLAGLKVFSENIIFGIGLGHSPRILSNSGYENDQFHNGYIEILVSGGIVLFIIYFLLASIFIYKLRILRLKNNLMGSIYLAGFLSLLFSTFFESLLLFRGGYFSGIITLFYIFMPLTLINSIKRL